jgi:hypothetical protein
MRWWRWLRRERDQTDALAAAAQRKKLDEARRDTLWITQVAAPALARLPANEFVERVRAAMTLQSGPERR